MSNSEKTSKQPIVGIFVSLVAPFENHIANGGEKLLGNASSIKRRPDGKVYISGQMQRHVFFSALKKLNDIEKKSFNSNSEDDPFDITQTFVSNADGITNDIAHDLRADLGGYMHTSEGENSERRTGALSVTIAVAKNESQVKNDLINRVAIYPERDPALATKEFSQHDEMIMNFYLDLNILGITENPTYNDGWNVSIDYIDHIQNDVERKRRARLFLQATSLMNDYANQSRNAVCGEPEKVIIVFDTIGSRKACRYFSTDKEEVKSNIIKELDTRQAKYFTGDDTTTESVYEAYKKAIAYLNIGETELYNPASSGLDKQ
jgi:CRISPR-associated protein Cst2